MKEFFAFDEIYPVLVESESDSLKISGTSAKEQQKSKNSVYRLFSSQS